MSKISQELKVLLYLNQKYTRTDFISIKEIADYLEVSQRQARRYLEDLNTIPDIDIQTKLGRNGGYKINTPLDKGFAMPENIVLAMSIAMKRNERIELVLSQLPNYVITDSIVGDNEIDNITLDKLEIFIRAIQNHKQVAFYYQNIQSIYLVDPYIIVLTNHTYYLYARHNDITKKFNVSNAHEIRQLNSFKFEKKVIKEITDSLTRYGIKNGKETILRVKCVDQNALLIFDKYFEGKGEKNLEELTYTVTGNSENELYYPLFRISTKRYEFLDEEFKNKYVNYLKNQIRSIENGKRHN